jgi:hypothetical protein
MYTVMSSSNPRKSSRVTMIVIYDSKLSRWQNAIKSSRAISRVRCIKESDVSRTISVIIRDVISDGSRNVGFIYTSDATDWTRRLYGMYVIALIWIERTLTEWRTNDVPFNIPCLFRLISLVKLSMSPYLIFKYICIRELSLRQYNISYFLGKYSIITIIIIIIIFHSSTRPSDMLLSPTISLRSSWQSSSIVGMSKHLFWNPGSVHSFYML